MTGPTGAPRPGRTLAAVPPRGPARVDPAAPSTIEAALARLEHDHRQRHAPHAPHGPRGPRAPSGPRGLLDRIDTVALRRHWRALATLADPRPLTARAEALREAADLVRRQHVDTAEDLGLLWDTWAGPDAEAVQRRMSSLARSAQSLVGELAATADDLDDAASAVVAVVHDLANRAHAVNQVVDDAAIHAFVTALYGAGDACAAGWARAERPPAPR